MKIIISENQLGLIRRISEIERLIDPTMDEVYEYLQGGDPSPLEKRIYGPFESTVVMKLANQLANKTRLTGDEKVTLRNQLQRYITNEYYSKIRDYFMSRLNNKQLVEDSEDPISPIKSQPLSTEQQKKLSDLLWKKIQTNDDLKSHLGIDDSFHTKENYMDDVSHKVETYFDPQKKIMGLEFPGLGPQHNLTFQVGAAPMSILNNLRTGSNNTNRLTPRSLVDVGIKIPLSDLLKK